eukprot:4710560-Ditylum_brightwellii.AAC.1
MAATALTTPTIIILWLMKTMAATVTLKEHIYTREMMTIKLQITQKLAAIAAHISGDSYGGDQTGTPNANDNDAHDSIGIVGAASEI